MLSPIHFFQKYHLWWSFLCKIRPIFFIPLYIKTCTYRPIVG